jgi:hypothetical protein
MCNLLRLDVRKLINLTLFLLSALCSQAQTPQLQWQVVKGGSSHDFGLESAQSVDGNIFIAGTSSSSGGNIPGNHGLTDVYIAKLTDSGIEVWAKNFGGTGSDSLIALAPCKDGGVVLLCKSGSNSTGKDFEQIGVYIVKLNALGSTVFISFVGGNPDSKGAILETSDSDYLFLSSKNIGGNGKDLWLGKLNHTGATPLIWEKTLRGTQNETPNDLLEYNGTYFLLGETQSPTVSTAVSKGGSDLLWAKSTSGGTISNVNLFGGSNNEFNGKMVLDENNLIYIAVTSYSSSSGDVFEVSKGGSDIWLFQIDQNGSLELGKNNLFGGEGDEFLGGLAYNPDLFTPTLAVESTSDTLYNKPSARTGSNIFLLQTIPFGGVDWAIPIGGSGDESPSSLLSTFDGGFLISGESTSSDGDLPTNNGNVDFAIFKLGYPCPSELDMGLKTFSTSVSRTADQFIKSASKFQGDMTYVKLTSGFILLEPGFETSSGVVFKTEIGGCP